MPVNQQRLIFRGRVLADMTPEGVPCTLQALGLEDGHTLHMVTRAPEVAAAAGAPRNGAAAGALREPLDLSAARLRAAQAPKRA